MNLVKHSMKIWKSIKYKKKVNIMDNNIQSKIKNLSELADDIESSASDIDTAVDDLRTEITDLIEELSKSKDNDDGVYIDKDKLAYYKQLDKIFTLFKEMFI